MKITFFGRIGAVALLAAVPFAMVPMAARAGQVTWSGTVDDTTIVSVHRGDVNTRVVSGKSASDVNTQIAGRLPARPVHVFLRQRSGRGRIRIIQQPSFANDFTARVRIHDPQSGSSFYHFVLSWSRPRPFGAGRGAF